MFNSVGDRTSVHSVAAAPHCTGLAEEGQKPSSPPSASLFFPVYCVCAVLPLNLTSLLTGKRSSFREVLPKKTLSLNNT